MAGRMKGNLLPRGVCIDVSVTVGYRDVSHVAHRVNREGGPLTVAGVNVEQRGVPGQEAIIRGPTVTEPPLQMATTGDLPGPQVTMKHRGGVECVSSRPRGNTRPASREKTCS